MTERIIELLHRNLHEVFGEGDGSRRRAAIDEFAGDLRATHPHFVYTPHGQPQALHNGGILAWGSGPKGTRESNMRFYRYIGSYSNEKPETRGSGRR